MKIFVGLGNPGEAYAETYHNAGFLALESIMPARDAGQRHWQKYKGFFEYFEPESGEVFVRPLTYMNESGRAVREALKKFRAKAD